eukprot:350666-Chlamydomonas_euryale.AAC.3
MLMLHTRSMLTLHTRGGKEGECQPCEASLARGVDHARSHHAWCTMRVRTMHDASCASAPCMVHHARPHHAWCTMRGHTMHGAPCASAPCMCRPCAIAPCMVHHARPHHAWCTMRDRTMHGVNATVCQAS